MASQSINIDKFRTARRRLETDPVIRIIDSDRIPSDQREQFRAAKVRDHVVSRTNELLRQLVLKTGRRRLPGQDTAEGRAAVALEHVLRTSAIGNIKAIDLDVLGSPFGLKRKSLEDLQSRLSHYINEIEGNKKRGQTRGVANSSTSRQGRSRSSAAAVGRTERAGASSSLSCQQIGKAEIIHDLSIRLGSFVHDTEGCARRAETLFENIKRWFIEESADHERGARLSDLKRNQAAYESACFYVSVKVSEGGGAGGGVGKNPRPNVGGAAGGGFSDGEEEESNLSIANVASAAKLSQAAVKAILPEVEKMAEEFVSEATNRRNKPQQKRQKGRQQEDGQRKNKKARGANRNAPTKRGSRRSSEDETLNDLLPPNSRLPPQRDTDGGDDADGTKQSSSRIAEEEDATIPPEEPPAFVPSAEFLAWKKRVLSEAMERARRDAASAGGGEQLSHQDALERAANEVVRRRCRQS